MLINGLVFWLSLEVLGMAFFALTSGRLRPAYSFLPQQSGYLQEGTDCFWGSTVFLHPYIENNYQPRDHCDRKGRNSYGFVGQEMPEVYDPNYYTLMFVGASVAEQIANFKIDYQKAAPYIEQFLNSHWVSPSGKPFKVLNSAIGGTAMPAEFFSLSLFLSRVDHVVSIDGFNEHWRVDRFQSLEEPNGIFRQLAFANSHPFTFAFLRFRSRLIAKITAGPLKYSYAAALFFEAVDRIPLQYRKDIDQIRYFTPYPPTGGRERINKEIVRTFLRYLNYAKELCEFEGKKFNNFLQPSLFYAKTPIGIEVDILQKNAAVNDGLFKKWVALIESENNPIIDSMVRLYEKSDQLIYDADVVHPNNYGTKIMVEHVATRLGEMNRWRRISEN